MDVIRMRQARLSRYGQITSEIRTQHGRDTEKQYGIATDIIRAAFARMPLVVCIANLPTRQDDSFRNQKARASPGLFVSKWDERSDRLSHSDTTNCPNK